MMPPTGGQLIFSLADVAFAFLFAGLIVGHYTKENESYELQLEMERRRSEALLLNILPPSIAARLQSGESNIADQHAEVTVLFADVVGFTPLAAGLDPTQTIKLLNSLFTAFDAIADKWGVEKIKTIGDSYMLVAGAPLPFDDHAERAAGAAIDLQREAAKLTVDGKKLSLRIGIHSGPVAAGVIGSRKFTYDLWGDTVNLASRLENISSDGRITVSAATAALLCESSFRLIPRGKLTIKGKGELEAFFLEGGDDCSFAA
jgi:class 3 adenylate cyclase